MNQEIKKQWVEALRSGKYEQCRGKLRKVSNWEGHEKTYCCLGVLTDLAVKAGVCKEEDGFGDGDFGYNYLSAAIQFWAGLDSENPRIDSTSLGRLNDEGRSFETIAKFIEDRL